jgi:hypothetical protein
LSTQEIGLLSGAIVALCLIPYNLRVYQGKIHPVPTSWALWSLIGLALLLTYRSSGAGSNLWPAVFGFSNPVIVLLLALRHHEKWAKLNSLDIVCLILGVVSLAMWLCLRESRALSQYALYVAIAADLCAGIPTFVFFWRNPERDRPFAWFLYAVGYFLAIFAITEHTVANYILPIYMTSGSLTATLLLAIPRIRRKAPIKDWI